MPHPKALLAPRMVSTTSRRRAPVVRRASSTTPAPVSYYPFAEKAHATIGVKLTSAGEIKVFGRARPQRGADMEELFSTSYRTLAVGEEVTFTLRLADYNHGSKSPLPDKVGIITVEPLDWEVGYEDNRAYTLGYLNPFGLDEMDYEGRPRPADIPANRTFHITMRQLAPDKAVFEMRDPFGQSEEFIDLSKLSRTAGTPPTVIQHGGVFAAIRVVDRCYDDGCATAEFPANFGFTGVMADGERFSQQTMFALNRSHPRP